MSTKLREIYANVFRVNFVWFRGQILSCLFSVLSRTDFFADRFSRTNDGDNEINSALYPEC